MDAEAPPPEAPSPEARPRVKRRFARTLWYGLAVVVAAPILYLALFIRFPATRDTPLPTLMMFGLGLGLIVGSIRSAWKNPAVHRGKVVAPIALTFGVALTGLFAWTLLVEARNIPTSLGAPRPGQIAPDFTLPDENDQPVSLTQLLASNGSNGVILVFYRGYW